MHDQATPLREKTLHYQRHSRPPTPSVITVTSGKGGVGKSTLVVNLALALSERGVRVLVLDADANLGSADIMLGVVPRFRLSDVLKGTCDIEDAFVTPYPGFSLLAGSSGEIDYPLMDEVRREQLLADLAALEQPFDLLLIDTAAGLTREVIDYGVHADEVLVVTGVEPTALMDGYAMIKVLSRTKAALPIHVILNAVRVPKEGEEAAAKLQKAVGHFLKRDVQCLGMIPFDSAVPQSIVRQEPLLTAFPRSAASLSTRALAAEILNTHLRSSVRREAHA